MGGTPGFVAKKERDGAKGCQVTTSNTLSPRQHGSDPDIPLVTRADTSIRESPCGKLILSDYGDTVKFFCRDTWFTYFRSDFRK